MKAKILFSILAFLLIAQVATSKHISALFSYAVFNHPEGGAYIETYCSVDANSLAYQKNAEEKYFGAFEITIIFYQNDKIVNYDKYKVNTTPTTEISDLNYSFLDQKRYALNDGLYMMKASIRDLHSNDSAFSISETIDISFPADEVKLSSIEFVESYKQTKEQNISSKSGYDIIPDISYFLPTDKSLLLYYFEIYNGNYDQRLKNKLFLRSYIQVYESKEILNQYVYLKQYPKSAVIPVFHQFNIKDLPSGNYQLVVEIVNFENKILDKKEVFFQRSNALVQNTDYFLDAESGFLTQANIDSTNLLENISCLLPIADNNEAKLIELIQIERNQERMENFLYHFWKKRNGLQPVKARRKYNDLVNIVNEKYSTQIHRGYNTDRGFIYLKYGKPNVIVGSNKEPYNYPYEIWHYYSLPQISNAKFVFYSPDISNNNYELIHSNHPEETSDRNWRAIIRGRGMTSGERFQDFSEEDYRRNNASSNKQWGDKLDEHYNNPL